MKKFKNLFEEHGAGFWGTTSAKDKLASDTPGQGKTAEQPLKKKKGLSEIAADNTNINLLEMTVSFKFETLQDAAKAERKAMAMNLDAKSEKVKGNKMWLLHISGKFTDIQKWLKRTQPEKPVEEELKPTSQTKTIRPNEYNIDGKKVRVVPQGGKWKCTVDGKELGIYSSEKSCMQAAARHIRLGSTAKQDQKDKIQLARSYAKPGSSFHSKYRGAGIGEELEEGYEKFQLVDMDADTARVAVQLAKKAGLQPHSKKSRSGGLDISVEGPKQKVSKFIMSLPESNLDEISQDKLRKYVAKATSDAGKASGDMTKGNPDAALRLHKRVSGVNTAQAKLDKKKERDDFDSPITSKDIKMAIGIANDPRYKQGNYSAAYQKISRLKKGLQKHPRVADALRRANEEHQCDIVDALMEEDGYYRGSLSSYERRFAKTPEGRRDASGDRGRAMEKIAEIKEKIQRAQERARKFEKLASAAQGNEKFGAHTGNEWRQKAQEKKKDIQKYQRQISNLQAGRHINDGITENFDFDVLPEAMTADQKAKRYLMIKKAAEKRQKASAKWDARAKRDAQKQMRDAGLFDEDLAIDEEIMEGAVAVSTVEKQIRSNGGKIIRPETDDKKITFTYNGGKRTVPVDRDFVIDREYMKLQKIFEGLRGMHFGYRDNSNDGNQGPRVVSKPKQEPELERLKKKLEFHYNQQAVHDEAERKYRKAASEGRKKGHSGVEANERRADEQEELAQKQMMKIQDIRDQIRDLKGKK